MAALAGLAWIAAPPLPGEEPSRLSLGAAVEREAGPRDRHDYRLEVTGEGFLRLSLEQRGCDAVLTLADGGGEVLVAVDTPADRHGTELLVTPATASPYTIRVEARTRGRYRLQADLLVPRDPDSRRRVAAERFVTEGARRELEGTSQSRRQAVAQYRKALLLWNQLGDEGEQAAVHHSLGALHRQLGDGDRALEHLERAVELWRAAGGGGPPARLATSLNLIGSVHYRRSDHALARAAYREALDFQRPGDDPCGQAQLLTNLGLVELAQGTPRRATEYFLEAAELCRAGDDPRILASIWTSLGGAYERLGELRRALEICGRALPLLDELGDRQRQAVILGNLGTYHRRLGEYSSAAASYRRALEIVRVLGDRRLEGTLLNSLGFLYLSLGDVPRALGHLEPALGLRRAVGDPRGEAVTLNNLGKAYEHIGRSREALDSYRQALELRRAKGDRHGEATTLELIGALYARLGDRERARTHLEEARARQRELGDRRSEARSLWRLAGLDLDLHRPQEARTLASQALALYGEVDDPVGEAEALTALARAERRLGAPHRALEHLERALEGLAGARASIAGAELRASFSALQRGAFEAAADLLMELHRGEPTAGWELRALELSERQRARGLLETLADLGDGAPPVGSSREIQALVDPQTLLLEVALGEQRSFLWAVSGTAVTVHDLPPRAEVEAAARRLHGLWSTLDAEAREERRAAAADLGELLLGPLAPRLGDFRRLALVADGALHYIPVAALPSPAAPSRRILETHEVVHLPSAAVLALNRRRPQEPRGTGLALIADPIFAPDDPRILKAPATRRAAADDPRLAGLARLPASRREAEVIAALAPEPLVLSGAAARRSHLVDGGLAGRRILHFATHGVLDSDRPEHSGLVLSRYDERGRSLDGFLSLADIYGLRIDADLVVLSGCQTALGREIRGEGLWGVSRGFLHAGAARVIASLWRVQDQATAKLMDRFYRALLLEGATPAAALRRAQLDLAGDRRWGDPYYWAAFVHHGDWR